MRALLLQFCLDCFFGVRRSPEVSADTPVISGEKALEHVAFRWLLAPALRLACPAERAANTSQASFAAFGYEVEEDASEARHRTAPRGW